MADIILPPFPRLHYPLVGRHPITNPWLSDAVLYKFHLVEHPDGSIGESVRHWGIDYGNTGYSTDGLAAFSGDIWRAGPSPHEGRGIEIVLDHDDGVHFASYCHLSEVYIEVGERVLAGQPIGRTGATGFATGPHLHLAIGAFVNGKVIWRNPLRKP